MIAQIIILSGLDRLSECLCYEANNILFVTVEAQSNDAPTEAKVSKTVRLSLHLTDEQYAGPHPK